MAGRGGVQDEFAAIKWDMFIVDEAHCLKNPKSKICEAATKVRQGWVFGELPWGQRCLPRLRKQGRLSTAPGETFSLGRTMML
jgi:hypothetical protein